MKYNPYWSWLQLSNGSLIQGVHGFNDTTENPNSTIFLNTKFGTATPTAMLWTGFQTPEFADGLMIKPLQPSSVEEIDYVYNFFGHSLRMVMNENGKIIAPGGRSDTFSFQFTPMAKTLWTEPKALLYAFQNDALTKSGVDISMPGSWGIDSYALASWGDKTGNSTVTKFAKALWNSEYQDVIQRLHPSATTYNPTSQPEIYYRSLYSFGLAGLILYPENSTTLNLAQQITLYGITDQLTPYGLPFGLEEDGWAVAMLYQLSNTTQVLNGVGQPANVLATYSNDISSILQGFQSNDTYNKAQTLSSWNLTSSSNIDYLPSIWNLNSSGLPNPGVYCNHPNIVFRCGESSFGILADAGLFGLPNYWNQPSMMTSYSLIHLATDNQPTGLAVDVRYADNSGNSNTETDPVCVLGLLAWENAMAKESLGGAYLSSLQGAEITSITQLPSYNTYYSAFVISLNLPPGKTANMTFNVGTNGPPDIVTDNSSPVAYTYNSTTGDVILKNVASTIAIGWKLSGGQGQQQTTQTTTSTNTTMELGTNLNFSNLVIYLTPGNTTLLTVVVYNSQSNTQLLINSIDVSQNGVIQVNVVSANHFTVNPFLQGSLQIRDTVPASTPLGSYSNTVSVGYQEGNFFFSTASFTITTVVVNTIPSTTTSLAHSPPPFRIDPYLIAILVVIVLIAVGVVAWIRRNS
ncbi:MAG TPA: hypothetical protein VFF30_14405 [Nitrososphaerales archaeon]|nr:hypothetical protein [Nitrososphaerales archaeon]